MVTSVEGRNMTVLEIENRLGHHPSIIWTRFRLLLDGLYLGAGYASAACIALVLATTLLQVTTRLIGINLTGLSTYAGYLMAASTFLGLSHALNSGSHIRIETISRLLGDKRRLLDLVAFGISGAIATWFAWYSCNMVYWTFALNDISTELDATPLWIPQATMAVGTVLFAISILDNFAMLLLTGKHRIQPSTEIL